VDVQRLEQIVMDDDYPVDAAWYEMQLLEREWLEELARDEAKRAEYERWLASTYTNRNLTCHAPEK